MKLIIYIILILLPSRSFCQIGFQMPVYAAAFSPITANLVGQYDATISSTVTNVPGVSKWADESGLGNDLLQSTSGSRPSYSSGVITMNGSNQFLTNTASITQPVTYYIVAEQITWVSNAIVIDGHTANTMMLRQSGTTPQVYLYAGSVFPTISGWTLNTFMVITCVVNGASSSISINDGTKTTSSQVGAANPGGIYLGQASFGGNSNIGVMMLLVYNSAHTALQQTANVSAIRSYLHI